MIVCQPKGFFTGDYLLSFGHGKTGMASFTLFGEGASLYLQDGTYEVTKAGLFSGRWNLAYQGEPIASADKASLFSRTFEITSDSLAFVLAPRGFLTRGFEFQIQAKCVGTIAPDHFFTRRTSIVCLPEIPVPLQLFAFTLAVFMWRRSDNSAPPAS